MQLRVVDEVTDDIDIVPLGVVRIAADIDSVSRGDRIIGYIQRAGKVYVALTGARLDRAEECCQSLLWDMAAAQLLREDDTNTRAQDGCGGRVSARSTAA